MNINNPKSPLRPARADELGYVQQHLALAIEELLGANSEFAQAEKSRFHRSFLLGLMEADPGYVVIVETPERQRAGFIIGVPEMGTIILSWGYIEPQFRKGTLAMRAFGDFVRHWDNYQFHKMVYYALPHNKQSEAIGRHAKFERVGELKRHFFGVDFVMYQKFYTKAIAGHAPATSVIGKRGRLLRRLRGMVSGKKA